MRATGEYVRRRAQLALFPAILLGAAWIAGASSMALQPPQTAGAPGETHALWVLRTSLLAPESIAALVRSAHDHGFNTLLVQVRGRGDAYYRNAIEPLPVDLLRQPDSFDPLAAVLAAAHAAGIRVHAWINVNLVSSAVDLPSARE